MSNSDKIKRIKLAAAARFGKETEIYNADRRKVDTKGDNCWQLRMIGLTGDIVNNDDAPCCRVDVARGDVVIHAIFYLKDHLSEIDLVWRFVTMIDDCEEHKRECAGV